MPKSKDQDQEVELVPDAWERFRSAVHAAAKSGPKHRPAKPVEASKGKALGKKAKTAK